MKNHNLANIEEHLVEVTQVIWATTLGIECSVPEPSETSQCSFDNLVACIQITGSWEGAVLVDCPDPLARILASCMLSLEPQLVDEDDMEVTLAELVNILAGNIRGLHAGKTQITLPTVARGGDLVVRLPGGRVIHEVELDCCDQRFKVALLKREAA